MSTATATEPDLSQMVDQAYKISDLIQDSQPMREYLRAKETMEKDPEAQKLIRDFQRKKDAYEEVQRFGKYHPDFKTITKDVRKFKRKVDMHPTIADFKQAESALDELLHTVANTLAVSVSDEIKVPSDNPFLDKSGGGCGTGGSCGCG